MGFAAKSVDERERLERVQAVERIDATTMAKLDSLTGRALALFPGALAAGLSLVSAERVLFRCRIGLIPEDVPRDVSICSHAILSPEVMVVPDLTQDRRFAQNSFVAVEGGLRFYIGAPLTGGVGTLCVIGRQPQQPSSLQIDGLVGYAMFASSQLMLCGALRVLSSSKASA